MIERKMIQKKSVSLILFFFTIIAILSFRVDGVYASTNGRTQDQAVAWANAQVGNPFDIDGNGAECVDFICYYYLELGQPYPYGNARDYVNGGAFCPAGWSYQSSPAPGDIAVWTGGDWGHVAIVTEIRGSQMVCVEQNYSYIRKVTANKHNIDAATYIRPDFVASAPPQETVNRVHPEGSANIINGTYTIASKLNPNMVFDVNGGGTSNGTNLLLHERHDGANQQFKITKEPDGKTYRMQAVCNDLFIDNGGSNDNGFNTHMWQWAGSGAQIWYIIDVGDGWFSFVNYDSGLFLDVENGRVENGTNIRQLNTNGSDAQKFRLIPTDSANISDGTYTIASMPNPNMVFDVNGGGTSNGTNLLLHERHDGANQQFKIIKEPDGKTYRMQSVCNDLYIDNGCSPNNGYSTYVWEKANTGGQKWYIIDAGDGWFLFVNYYSGLFLDVENGRMENGTNIRQLNANGSDAQKFRLIPTDSANISDGTYTISSMLNPNMVFDVNGGGTSNGTNLLLHERHDGANQQFKITKEPDGKTYRMQAVCNDLFIDNGCSPNNGYSTYVWEKANTGGQKWYIIDAGDGWFLFVNYYSGLFLDVENGRAENGTDIRQLNANGSNAQKFRLIPIDSANISDGTYTIESKLNSNMVFDVNAGGTDNGTNLLLHQSHNGENQKFRITKEPDGKTYRMQAVCNNLYIDNGCSPNNGYSTYVWEKANTGGQKWYIIDAGDGWFLFVNYYSGLFLDVENGRVENGTNIRQLNANGSDAQKFRFVPVATTSDPSESGGDNQPEQSAEPVQPEQPIDTGLPQINYRTHVQNVGWQSYVSNGTMAGTSGRSLRLEGMNIHLQNQPYTGDIEYRTHIQNIGWESDWKRNDVMSGTSGRSYRLEAMQVRLTGEMAEHYDVYYRVHAQNFGWLGWAKNGEQSGTAGFGYRLEGMQIMLVEKGGAAPNLAPACNDIRAFVQR